MNAANKRPSGIHLTIDWNQRIIPGDDMTSRVEMDVIGKDGKVIRRIVVPRVIPRGMGANGVILFDPLPYRESDV